MARIFTTPAAEQAAKVLMHDITVAGGINTKNLRTYSLSAISNRFVTASQAICTEITERNFDDLDQSIRMMSNYSFYPNYSNSGNRKSLKPEGVAKAIVWFAEQVGLYWDDTVRTPYEVDEFKKTLLGDAVYKYGRYISAIPDKAAKSRAANASSNSSTATAGGGQPKNGYKQSGPQSGNVRDLRDETGTQPGTPGQKAYADGPYIYKIVGENPQSKNTPNVFIKPLSASGAKGSTNQIFFSSGNGYTDCTCYFDDPNDAQNFLNKVVSDNRVPANVTNVRVVKNKADSNGYFIVGTEYGIVAISAKTLNEALQEPAAEEVERPVDWEKATESYTKEELDELHTWMRRG